MPELMIFGSELFTSETPAIDAQLSLAVLMIGFSFVEIALGVWGFALVCHTVAEVQSYRSAWRGLGNILLAGSVIGVPLVLLVILILALGRV